jgi:hypothetical protein
MELDDSCSVGDVSRYLLKLLRSLKIKMTPNSFGLCFNAHLPADLQLLLGGLAQMLAPL